MKLNALILVVCLSPGLLILAGCNQDSSGSSSDSAGFAPGAFPPTISAKEHHKKAWTNKDCMVCHENGINKAPKMIHSSLTELAKQSKCRTCHVPEKDTFAEK